MPLAIILLFRLIEEIAQQVKIYRRDKRINNQEYSKLKNDGTLEKIKAGAIKVGDVIKLTDNRVPADLIILASK